MSPFFSLMPPLSTSLQELKRMVEILQASIEAVTLGTQANTGP
jgi:adenosylmethionine-8-amino-7-oxononanoate aminotransferase